MGTQYQGTSRNGDSYTIRLVQGHSPTVNLPADAELSVAGIPSKPGTAVRTFVSPPLEAGKDYPYTLQADMTHDGLRLTASKQVPLRAGRETHVTFEFPRTRITRR